MEAAEADSAQAVAATGPRPLARRLVSERGRLVEWRPAVVAAGLAARLLRLRAHALWPNADRPLSIVDVGSPKAAAWMRATFEATGRQRRFPAPATWDALRARAVLIGRPSRLAVEAAELALARPVRRPRLALYSPTGAPDSKATGFVFEPRRREPSAVVKVMADPGFESRLRSETETVESLRSMLAGRRELADALPLEPLFAGSLRGDYVVVQDPDPLAPFTGQATQARALEWLSAFHAATTSGVEPWDDADARRELDHVDDAWRRGRPQRAGAVAARLSELLAPLAGLTAPRCAIHGDYWRGNIAAAGDAMRVYDWEWVERDGRPFFDLWLYELGELRARGAGGRDLRGGAAESVARVERELEARGLDRRFALATLPGAIALITYRERHATGLPGSGEEGSVRVMAAVEELLLSPS